MGLVLALNRYDWPVLVPYPNPTIVGQFEQRTLTATFQPIDNDTEEELLTGLARAGRQRDQRRERLRLVLKGLSGLLDASGATVSWAAGEGEDADQRLEQILNDPRLVPALDRAYIASVAGTSPGKVPAAKEGYVLDTAATWRFPIDVELPDPKRAGKTVTHRLIGTFKDLPLNEAAGNTALIQDVLVDVDGFQDATGKALPWAAVRSEAWKNPFISNAILLAYQRGIDGTAVQARREKN